MTGADGGWASPGGERGPAPATPQVAAGAPQQVPQQAPQQWGGGWDASAVPTGWGAGPAQSAAPRPGVVPLRPLGLGELLDGAVQLVRGYPAAALGASAVVALISTLVQLVLLLTVLGPLLQVDEAALEAGDAEALTGLLAGAGAGGVAAFLLSIVTSALLTGALSAIAGKGVLGQPCSVADLQAALRGKYLRLVGTSFLVQLAVLVPFALAAAAGGLAALALGDAGIAVLVLLVLAAAVVAAVLYVRLALAASAVALEDARATQALRRSNALVRGSSWRVLGVLVLTAVVAAFAAQVLSLPFQLFGEGDPLGALTGSGGLSTQALVLSTVGAGFAMFVVEPFAAGVTALLYVDRRMRAEGLDVALQAAAAQGR